MEYKYFSILLVLFFVNYYSTRTYWQKAPWRRSYSNPHDKCQQQDRSNLYTWHDLTLPFQDFSPPAFCASNYNDILFIGDSTTHGMFMSLVLLLGADYRDIVDIKVRFYTNVNICGKNITFIRNDDLAEHPCFPTDKRICLPFISEMASKDLLIINRGAHYAETPLVLRDIDNFMSLVSDDQRVIYRETVTGHALCDLKKAPDDIYIPSFTATQKNWGWHLMDAQNTVVTNHISDKYPLVDILRVAASTKLRGDMHIGNGDCLHYCTPGPVDHWNRLLLIAIYNIGWW